MRSRRALLVSPYFPPSTLAGVHRARHLAKHLPSAGWHPIVVCVDEAYHADRLEPGLAELLPLDLDIVKTSSIPAGLARRVGVGDLGLRSYHALAAAIGKVIGIHGADLVFITGSPFYPMLLAGMVKRRFGRPVVLDFQDPWVSRWGAGQRPLSKPGLVHALAKRLEPIAVKHADFVTSVSEIQNEEMTRRYPWLDRSRMAAVPIGGDPDDYAYLRAHPVPCGEASLPAGLVHFAYVGTFLPRAAATVECLLEALAMLRRSEPVLAGRLRFNFIGTSNRTNAFADYRVRPIAQRLGIADLVCEVPQRISYLEALSVMANSHALLLIGSDERHYTASKVFPALLSGRPSLALFHRESSAYDILARAGGCRLFGFTTAQELSGLTGELATAIRDLAQHPETVRNVDRDQLAPYEARQIARQFAGIFDSLVR